MSGDYSSTGGGLKLKGVSTGAGVTKKKKKKKNNTSTTTSTSTAESETSLQKALKDEDNLEMKGSGEDGSMGVSGDHLKELDPRDQSGKTASERAHEEMRRRRLNDRLKREGVKTHKERVEELNRYLSTLSEHHDMPKIGPG
ncbi:hypothetical protein SS1G_12352 [Sclerotinia sclerotiorum 1980 UF-70]|uniref:DUF1754-domain-containing protein n=2 Tax=Sclerotinia sclerotiorum (strain ATCC 18683 / 1980 / Ss-1) TaxID=665079 RepID=A7F354_SCLS1|nr:hypothetical protein SS1G_12352 [Sclerotinia sclerotiorum 1980 UF-70]APA09535.1 hypothetical protein sscle_05g043050 [Sclerotinia sclerotiorum 1980 UF-70]EDN96146.1 hypothetical protein SS1G_12352 [Sclerotinia sclerotiorum 1980 UF-70]